MLYQKYQARLSLYQISVVLLLLLLTITTQVRAQCTGSLLDYQSSRTIVCLYEVKVTRLYNCSTHIVEKIIFPYGNTTEPWARQIQLFNRQSITPSSLSLEKHGRTTAVSVVGAKEDTILLPLEVSRQPLVFILTYIITNGVTNYIGECNFDNDTETFDSQDVPKTKLNILQWGTNNSSIIVEVLSVSFSTTDKNAKLMFGRAEHGTFTGQNVSFTKVNLLKEITLHVLETGTESCSVDWGCGDIPQPSEGPEGSLITEYLPIISVGAVIAVMLFLFCLACLKCVSNRDSTYYDVPA